MAPNGHEIGQSVAQPGDCGDIAVNLRTPDDALATGALTACHPVEPPG